MSQIVLIFFILLITPVSFRPFNSSNNIQKMTNNFLNKTTFKNFITPTLTSSKESSLSLYMKFLTFVTSFWLKSKIMNVKILSDRRIRNCLSTLLNILKDTDNLGPYFLASGKALNDLGNEFECPTKNNEGEFNIFHFYLENSSYLSNIKDKPLVDFTDQHYFYIGLCFIFILI